MDRAREKRRAGKLSKNRQSYTDNFNVYLALSNFSNFTTNWRFLKFKGKKTPITHFFHG